jgi:hypothetical protein
MMKKLFLLCIAIFAINSVARAQIVKDTLRYFLYKQMYNLPMSVQSTTIHPFFKSPPMVFTNTLITHVGSIFRNKDTNLLVTGLESRVLSTDDRFSGIQGVPFRLYLCDLVNNAIVFPPRDSISGKVPANEPKNFGSYFGGTFTNTPVNVKGDFAVLARCVSTYDGDTVKIFRTNGHKKTSTTAPSANHKFGEGLGVIRKGGVFFPTTDFADPRFGPGTDYEFCLAPMVQFSLQVSQIESPTQEGACEWEVFTNTNTSSPELTNRQFNFNEFYRQLKPFHPASTMNGFAVDSVLTWDMGDGQTNFYYLPAGKDTVVLCYCSGVSNMFFTGSMCGKYKQAAYNTDPNYPSLSPCISFTASTVWCNDSAGSGIHEMGRLSKLKIYPNPTVDKTIISGLEGPNTINIYNMMGQLVATEVTTDEVFVVDLLKQPKGNYLIRINNSQNNTRLVKIIRE